MFDNGLFMKTVTRLVLTAFVYSFVIHEPLYAAIAIETSDSACVALNSQLDKLVLSARQGRIAEGSYQGSGRLVVFIQDLHCNPDVQRNISEILGLLDSRYGLSRIYVEAQRKNKPVIIFRHPRSGD